MEDGLAALDGLADGVFVAQVAGEELDLGEEGGGELAEQAGVTAGVVADEGAQAGAGLNELFDEVATDEAAGAGDEDALGLEGGEVWHGRRGLKN